MRCHSVRRYELNIGSPSPCSSIVGRATMVVAPTVAARHATEGPRHVQWRPCHRSRRPREEHLRMRLRPMTARGVAQRFGYDPASVAEWALGFESPKAVYESGPTGFHLCRALGALGVDCAVGAVSKMHRPAADRGRKNDRRDAEWLARLLACRNVVEVWVPDGRTEAARDLSRALEDARDDLQRARQRMSKFLLRHGLVLDETTPTGRRSSNWTGAYWVGEVDRASTRPTTRPPTSTTRTRWTAAARPEGARAQGGRGRLAPRVGADGRRAMPGEGRRRRHRVPARRRGGRLLEVPERAVVRRAVRARALGALERRDRVPRRDRGAGELHVRRALVEASWHVPMSTRHSQAAEAGPRSRHGGVEAPRSATAACRTGATPCRRRERGPAWRTARRPARWPAGSGR